MILETERTILRELRDSDVDSLFGVLSDPSTMRYYPRPFLKEEVKGWIERSMTSYKENGFGLYAATLKEDNSFMGQCGISYQNIYNKRVPEIGYQIKEPFWVFSDN